MSNLFLTAKFFTDINFLITRKGLLDLNESDHKHIHKLHKDLQRLPPIYRELLKSISYQADLVSYELGFEIRRIVVPLPEGKKNSVSFDKLIDLLKDELGDNFEKVEAVSREAVAATHMSQDHIVKLKNSSDRLLMHIQFPADIELIKQELTLIKAVIAFNTVVYLPRIQKLHKFIRTFVRHQQKILNLNSVANENEELAKEIENNISSGLIVPKSVKQLTTKNIYTFQYIKPQQNQFKDWKDLLIDLVFVNNLLPDRVATIYPQKNSADSIQLSIRGTCSKIDQNQKSLLSKLISEISIGKRMDITRGLLRLSGVNSERELEKFDHVFRKYETVKSDQKPTSFLSDLVYTATFNGFKVPEYVLLFSCLCSHCCDDRDALLELSTKLSISKGKIDSENLTFLEMTEKELYKYRATHKQSRKNLIALIWIVLALTSFMFSILFSDPASMLPLIVLAIAVIIITVSLIFIFLL